MDWVVSLRVNKVAISVSHVITASTPSSSSSSNFHGTNREEGEGGDQVVHAKVNQIPIGSAFNRTRCRRCNLNNLWWQLFSTTTSAIWREREMGGGEGALCSSSSASCEGGLKSKTLHGRRADKSLISLRTYLFSHL